MVKNFQILGPLFSVGIPSKNLCKCSCDQWHNRKIAHKSTSQQYQHCKSNKLSSSFVIVHLKFSGGKQRPPETSRVLGQSPQKLEIFGIFKKNNQILGTSYCYLESLWSLLISQSKEVKRVKNIGCLFPHINAFCKLQAKIYLVQAQYNLSFFRMHLSRKIWIL